MPLTMYSKGKMRLGITKDLQVKSRVGLTIGKASGRCGKVSRWVVVFLLLLILIIGYANQLILI